MDISIQGRNVEVSELLRATVEEKVTRLGRYLDSMERAEVRFLEERNPRIADKEVCEVTVVGHGHIVRARAAASDTFAAVDRVVDKLEHRLEKLKGRLIGRSHPRRHAGGAPGPDAVAAVIADDDEDAEDETPRIIRTVQSDAKPMTPEEAVLELDLLGRGFFLFTNAETGRAAVVYRRKDSQIGLIDTT
ncbi:MAG TPA: ribosome-associated translation inhibitor RaiA [Acidimicrobiales bacterium]